MGSIAYALAAGNAVVFKPSEYTPGVGGGWPTASARWCPEHPTSSSWSPASATTGAALCRAGVDKIAFTGSTATGRKVMAACAENLTPVLMECGGKDAMIVDDDADVAAAADAALWGGDEQRRPDLHRHRARLRDGRGLRRVRRRAHRAGAQAARRLRRRRVLRPDHHAGPAGRHPAARRRRAGPRRPGPDRRRESTAPYVEPTVLVDVPEDAAAVREETFGPTLTVTRVRGRRRGAASAPTPRRTGWAARCSAARPRGLAARPADAVGDDERQLRDRLRRRCRRCRSAASATRGSDGIHGADGLREFARAKAITRQRFGLPMPLLSFTRSPKVTDQLAKVIGLLHGRR